MMTNAQLSLDQARRIAVRAQLLDLPPSLSGKEAAAAAIEHLGYVQIDTIAVVERAHHHTLWVRCPDYDPSFLHDLVAVDRRVFEYWAHAIAFLPISDYRFYIPRMLRHRNSGRAWLSDWKKEHGHVLDQVLHRIRTEGALASKDFELPPGTKRGTWWDWKPAKRALEILFWQGDLMISERDNFQKIYDLTERVLPSGTDTSVPAPAELGRFHVLRALAGLGVAREREIHDAFHIADRGTIAASLSALQPEGKVVPLQIEGLEDIYFALPETLEHADSPPPNVAHVLSPFDNFTIQRERLSRLFGFDYTIECYLPEVKRKYGYYVLPLLWRDQLIGRLDAKADRKASTLLVKKLWFEPSFLDIAQALPALSDALVRYARFNRCTSIEFGSIVPTGHKRELKSHVKRWLDPT